MLDFDFNPEAPEWSKRLGAFDLETTGLDLREARIVSACVAVLDAAGETPSPPSQWLLDPKIEIPEQAAAVHGITTQIARDTGSDAAQGVAEIIASLRDLMGQGVPVVAFNAPYDFTILHFEALRYGITPLNPSLVIDPLVLDRKVMQFRRGKRTLTVLAADYSVELTDAHNSTADAIAAGRLAQAQGQKFPELNISADQLHTLQVGWSEEQNLSFAKYMRAQNPNFLSETGWPLKK